MSFGAGNGVTTLGFTGGFTKLFFIYIPIKSRSIPDERKIMNVIFRIRVKPARPPPPGIRVVGFGFTGLSASEMELGRAREFLREIRVIMGQGFGSRLVFGALTRSLSLHLQVTTFGEKVMREWWNWRWGDFSIFQFPVCHNTLFHSYFTSP